MFKVCQDGTLSIRRKLVTLNVTANATGGGDRSVSVCICGLS